ncbi:MAG: phosphoenolpyruvate---glycerone phosphotransferase subunit DhaL, partial [Baekduia sp.]|nr:phosphoenolpyruvate---glycerone phosphotransferase subunit DhaL [Baekduia sp.]
MGCVTQAPATITHAAVMAWIRHFAAAVEDHRVELVRLDTAIGDGDHGTNLDRGMHKVLEKLEGDDGEDIGASLKAVGMALVSSVGGAAGPLYGTLFLQMGATAGA